jgi:hypothetical protein
LSQVRRTEQRKHFMVVLDRALAVFHDWLITVASLCLQQGSTAFFYRFLQLMEVCWVLCVPICL